MTVAIVVPLDPGNQQRDENWAWLRERLEEQYPEWLIVEGRCGGPAWRKGVAVADAVRRTDADTLVVTDADLWCETVPDAIEAVLAGAPWVIPHLLVHRLSAAGSRRVMAGAVASRHLGLAQSPYPGVEGGGLVVLPRTTAVDVPIDPRFAGWGGEDISWGWALRTIVGPPVRLRGDLWHLWHPPQERRSRTRGSEASEALAGRYRRARGALDAMRVLVDEAKEAVEWATSASC